MSEENKSRSGMLNYTELGSFFENMAMMVKSGISVPEAALLLKEEADPAEKTLSGAITSVSDGLSTGMPLGDAMKSSGAFPDYSVDMVS